MAVPAGFSRRARAITIALFFTVVPSATLAPIAAGGAFDFSLTGIGSITVTQGESVSETVTATLSSGKAEPVEFAARGLPPGTTYLFSTAVCNPTCVSTFTVRTTLDTPPGSHRVEVTGAGAGRTRFAPVTLLVTRAAASPAERRFEPYNRVRPTAQAAVHARPSSAAPLLGSRSDDAVGTIVGGPIVAEQSVWWNVDFDGGPSGWMVEDVLTKESAAVSRRGDCSSEGGLAGRADIVFCEPWEDPAWWQNGYAADGSKAKLYPATPGRVARTRVVADGCVSGKCLEVNMRKGEAGALALHWLLASAGLRPEELFIRYYLKLSANFDPNLCAPDGSIQGSGGKLPGPADVRTDADPGGQCGNGGNPADGIHCWSMRSTFRDCYGGSSGPACVGPGPRVRFGHYAYFYKNRDFWGVSGYWDTNPWSQSTGDGGTCRTVPNNMVCGVDHVGNLMRDRWYRIEIQVKMNTPGRPDGILRGWLDGERAFEKTNIIYRLPGHDDLHVRSMWLNVHKGGDYPNGNCIDQKVWLDQMVLATGGLPGPWRK